MRLCAGLALSVAVMWVSPSGAGATTYCNDPISAGAPECVQVFSPQQALNMAAAHPGFDTVVLGAATYDVGAGLVYSDGGSASNGVRIEGRTRCIDKYTCPSSKLSGGAPGTAVLSLDAPGGSDVRVVAVGFQVLADDVTGLALGPGTRAEGVSVSGSNGPGVSLRGTASSPAIVTGFASLSGSPAVDAPGYGVVEGGYISGPVGAHAGVNGSIDIRGSSIEAFTGVTGTRVKVTGSAIRFARQPSETGTPVGIEAACADASAPDAIADITNVTLVRVTEPGAVGVRAAGRGGDGTSCDATVHMSSSIVQDADVSLDAHGEAGTGADPQDGVGRVKAAYSNFRAAATRVTGPGELETSSPGQNVDTDPGLVTTWWPDFPLLWSSPLIDAGDPAAPDAWQQPFVEVIHGRRDIGASEYGFHRPRLTPGVYPELAATGTLVRLDENAYDPDPGDPLGVEWTLPDRTTSSDQALERRFWAPGRYRFHVRVTDPTGQVSEADLVARVVDQRLSGLRVRPRRFRTPGRYEYGHGATIHFVAVAAGIVDFRVHRATHPRGRSRIRWRRVPGKFNVRVSGGVEDWPFNGWIGRRRLKPGVYRLTAAPRSDGTGARTRFRIVR